MREKPKIQRRFVKYLFRRIYKDDILALSAQAAYYLILSIFPFLISVITIISYTPITSDRAIEEIGKLLPSYANIIVTIIKQTVSERSIKLFSVSTLTTIWVSSSGLSALMNGINKAYNLKETRSFVRVGLISIGLTFAVAVVFIFSLVMLVFGRGIMGGLYNILGLSSFSRICWNILRYVIPIFTMLIVFAIIYYYVPNRKNPIKWILPGTLFATVGCILLSSAFSYYVSLINDFSKMYGSLGGIIALLIWIYWSCTLVLIGGEVNASISFMLGIKKKAVRA